MLKQISLNGEWSFQQLGTETWSLGTVPGCVQLDLLHLGQVPDPFYRMNETHMHALEDKEWLYRKTFTVSQEDLDADELDLVFEGVDTTADIYVNGVYLDKVENMFIAHRYDVTDLLTPGENNVEVRFYSPLTGIRDLYARSPLTLQSSCEIARPYIRKAQYAYGWDWGPRIAQVGLWRPVYLEAITDAALRDPFFYTVSLEPERAHVRVRATVEDYTDETLTATVTVALDGETAAQRTVPVENIRGEMAIDTLLEIEHPQLWWPNGSGAQPLYEIHIQVQAQPGDSEPGAQGEDAGRVLAELRFRSGIRTVRILQESDIEGRSFIFEINGVRIFCKGADWIPADSLLPRLTRDDYYTYIRLTRDAHMNMLRIWGGGIYEDRAFYDACDELGIMVWQDFMYACAQYPDELDWFQKLAEEEAVSVVRDLRNHPALVLWCGNNENNWGFDEWWSCGATPKFMGNYVYREILPRVTGENDPSRPYWVSSPYGGEHPNSMTEGDRHSWDVWSRWGDYSGYERDSGRFLSEFGFQAMPDWKTVLSYTEEEDRHVLSPVVLSHQKMVEGMEKLVRFLVGRVGFPKDFQSFVYLTQFNQAEAIRTGVEHWRRRKFMTSGALYWQLNDCWPVASWSCLDYYKRKKGLYYYSQRFFANVLPLIRLEEGGAIVLYGVSDLLAEAEADVRVAAFTLDGRKLVEQTFKRDLLANDVTTIKKFAPGDLGIGFEPRVLPVDGKSTTLPMEHNGALLDAVVYVDFTVDGQTYSNYAVFDRFRVLNLARPEFDVQVAGNTITLRSNVPAFGVFLEPEHDVDLSDNCLNLEPGKSYTITCSDAPGNVQVRSLVDMVTKI